MTDKIVDNGEVAEHVERLSLTEIMITPEHEKRKESKLFKESKKRLKADGHYRCYICGCEDSKENKLQAHHYGAEWSMSSIVDYQKLKLFCEEWDLYGYGRLMKNILMDSPDDVRNFMILCANHHVEINKTANNPTSIHHMTFPYFIMQKLSLDGLDPIPQQDQTEKQVEDAIKKYQDEEVLNEEV